MLKVVSVKFDRENNQCSADYFFYFIKTDLRSNALLALIII